MLDFLKAIPDDRLIGGIYYAVRLITHISRIRDLEAGYFVEGVPSEPTREDRHVGMLILDELQTAAGKSVAQWPRDFVQEQVSQLSRQLQQMLHERWHIDEHAADALLEELRKNFGGVDSPSASL